MDGKLLDRTHHNKASPNVTSLIQTLSGNAPSTHAFGTMQFGVGTPEPDCAAVFNACREAGITVFDTAFGYTDGASETILGKLVAKERDDLLILTKCAHPAPSTRANILSQVDTSRKRLNMDVIDVLFLHRWDANTPLEETLGALAELQEQGIVRSLGVSNFSAWQVMKAQAVCAGLGTRIDVIQPMYNLVKRQAEVELFPMCLSEGIAVTPYSPVAGGLLSGKYGRGGSGRLDENPEYTARYSENWVRDTAGAFAGLAADLGEDSVTLAVMWAARHPAVTAPLISGRTLDQLRPSLAAIGRQMPDDLYDRVANLSRTPPPATDRLEEQIGT